MELFISVTATGSRLQLATSGGDRNQRFLPGRCSGDVPILSAPPKMLLGMWDLGSILRWRRLSWSWWGVEILRCLVLSQVDGIDLLYILQIRIWYIYIYVVVWCHINMWVICENQKNINIPGELMIKISPSRIKPRRFESFIPIVSRGRT